MSDAATTAAKHHARPTAATHPNHINTLHQFGSHLLLTRPRPPAFWATRWQ